MDDHAGNENGYEIVSRIFGGAVLFWDGVLVSFSLDHVQCHLRRIDAMETWGKNCYKYFYFEIF